MWGCASGRGCLCVHMCEDATCESKCLLHMRVNILVHMYNLHESRWMQDCDRAIVLSVCVMCATT